MNKSLTKTVKKKRIFYIDLLKFISILCMVFIHVNTTCIEIGMIEESAIPNAFVNLIYVIAPTIFMLTMGMCIKIKNADSKTLLKTGLKILFIGILLNVLRGSTFIIKGIAEPAYRSDHFLDFAYWLVGNDILYFAGLFYLFYALIKKLKINDYIAFLIALIFFIIGNILIGKITIENDMLDLFIGNFIYLDYNSYFNLLLWTIFPMLGIVFQIFFDKVKNKDKYVVSIGLSGLAILCFLFAILLPTDLFKERYIFFGLNGFCMDYLTTLFVLSINAIYIMLIYFIAKPVNNISSVKKNITIVSSNLTNIYFVHWILYMYLINIIFYFASYKINRTIFLFIYAFIILIISTSLGILLGKLIKKN